VRHLAMWAQAPTIVGNDCRMELNAVERRILGSLVEKAATTPDNYPLSSNALVNACNQSSNRDPVMNLDERAVDTTMLELRTNGLARTVTGGRANKHRHVLDEAWGLSPAELAVIAVLFLRGPQTVGELRTRTDRLHDFADLAAIDQTLARLVDRSDPFVTHLERLAGYKERRWAHLLGDEDPAAHGGDDGQMGDPGGGAGSPTSPGVPGLSPPTHAESDLGEEVARLRADVDRLYALLGESPMAP
jgi:uncharacterized protein YceH (UPF0502 family)